MNHNSMTQSKGIAIELIPIKNPATAVAGLKLPSGIINR